jgi:hypothetical protein
MLQTRQVRLTDQFNRFLPGFLKGNEEATMEEVLEAFKGTLGGIDLATVTVKTSFDEEERTDRWGNRIDSYYSLDYEVYYDEEFDPDREREDAELRRLETAFLDIGSRIKETEMRIRGLQKEAVVKEDRRMEIQQQILQATGSRRWESVHQLSQAWAGNDPKVSLDRAKEMEAQLEDLIQKKAEAEAVWLEMLERVTSRDKAGEHPAT